MTLTEIKQKWEDDRDNTLGLGMCCPNCLCGHCETRREIVNKIILQTLTDTLEGLRMEKKDMNDCDCSCTGGCGCAIRDFNSAVDLLNKKISLILEEKN